MAKIRAGLGSSGGGNPSASGTLVSTSSASAYITYTVDTGLGNNLKSFLIPRQSTNSGTYLHFQSWFEGDSLYGWGGGLTAGQFASGCIYYKIGTSPNLYSWITSINNGVVTLTFYGSTFQTGNELVWYATS